VEKMQRFSRLAVLTVLAGAAFVWGASPRAHAGSAPAPAYSFASGDVLDITVQPQQGYDRAVTVQPDGKIAFPVVGEVIAAGLTITQLTERLQQGLCAELKHPRVTVSLREMNRGLLRRVSVLGAVKTPGVYELKEQSTVAELLATAGGPTPVADLRRVTITRADGSKKVIANLAASRSTGELNDNVAVEAGDLIVVPEGAPPAVMVLGEVAKPGSYEFQGEARLLDAISMASGPTPMADLQHVLLTHAGGAGTQSLNVQPLLVGDPKADPGINVRLQPGDTVVLTVTEQRVYVLGRVAKPDTYALKPNDRVLDLLAKAGGTAVDADISRAVLVRRDEKGKPVARPVDLKKVMEKGRMASNEVLLPGDLLFVPDRRARQSRMEIANLLWPISSLLSVVKH
jgi:protein involved in polysaccharide export with SLBB domain